MANAAAKYILSAEDKTKGAVASVKRGFESLNSSAKKVAKGMKAFGVGVLALKAWRVAAASADTAIQNLAKTNADFARTLAETEKAYEDMHRAGALTIEAQEALNKAVKDPALQQSMRAGADLTARIVTEVKMLGIAWQVVLARSLQALGVIEVAQERIERGPNSGRGYVRDLGDMDAAKKLGDMQNKTFDDRIKAEAKAAADARKKAAEDEEKYLDEFAKGLVRREELMREYRDSVIDGTTADKMFGQMQRDLIDEETGSLKQSLDDFAAAGIDTVGQILDESERASKELSIYADQAARNMQDAFADFLFDPFDKGVKGMLKGFIDVTRRMIAEQAAAKLFGGGFGKFLTGAVGSLFGGGGGTPTSANFSGPRAAGGPVSGGKSYLIGERGPELFTPGTSGHITPNHALGVGVVQNITVDARGATVDAIRAIPAAMAEAKRQAVDEVADMIRRGRL